MDHNWFEMRDIRARALATSVWIPLRAMYRISETGEYGHEGYELEFFGAGSVAVPMDAKTAAEQLDYSSVGPNHHHGASVGEHGYVPTDAFSDWRTGITGLHLVLEQHFNSHEPLEWYLHQDLVIALGLRREGDSWVRPSEDYLEIAHLKRKENGSPAIIEIRASHLRDYLRARDVGLAVTSYRERVRVLRNTDEVKWSATPIEETDASSRWRGSVMEIHAGGMPYGEEVAVFHAQRTDVDPEEDVPILGLPNDGNIESKEWVKKFAGEKLFRVSGELWRREWIDPAAKSLIVRGDEIESNIEFTIDAEGKKEASQSLIDSGRWLWFKPEVMSALAHRRGGSLSWYTRDTGSVACSPDHDVHFGVNAIGLINVYAKDIAELPEWQQRVWAAYNVGPEGKVSDELQASQVRAMPAMTTAPEAYLPKGLDLLNALGKKKLGVQIVRPHEDVPKLFERIHRFRATNKEGLFALAKDVARVTADSIDAAQLQTIKAPPKGVKWGSLKSLENVLATKYPAEQAHGMLTALAMVYDLRLADAHLPSQETANALKSLGTDETMPHVIQGFQLLDACARAIHAICVALKKW